MNIEPESSESGSPTVPHRVLRVTDEERAPEDIQVVVEEPLAIEINGRKVAVLMRLPGHEKELAAGFCLSEGLVSSLEDILLIHHCGSGLPAPGEEHADLAMTSRNRVEVRVRPGAWQETGADVARLIRSGCGATGIKLGDLGLVPIESDMSVEAEVLLSLNAAMRQAQGLFRDVGAVHAAAIFSADGSLVTLQEDIGRHNAMDKAIGHCVLRGIPLADKIIATTGRASYEMVAKAVHVGIPVVASFSSPTSLAVQVAELYNCTLIGYMRGKRLSIYTHPQRLQL